MSAPANQWAVPYHSSAAPEKGDNLKNRKTGAARFALMPACLGLFLCLTWSTALPAQTPPTIAAPANPAFFAIPAGMKAACVVSATDETISRSCPVIHYLGITTWAYGFEDNRASFGIVSYDSSRNVVRNVTLDGARNVYKITSDTEVKTVTFWGEGDARIVLPWSAVGKPTVYKWVSKATPPANSVTAPSLPNKAVCRGTGEFGDLLVGYWNGARCMGYTGIQQPVLTGLQFLALVSGSVQWQSTDPRPPCIGILPGDAIDAGNNSGGVPQILCSAGGYVGYVFPSRPEVTCQNCIIGDHDPGPDPTATVLVGSVQ